MQSPSISLLLAALLLLGAFVACGGERRGETVITVFAAASLTEAFWEIAHEFESSNPGVTVQLNFGGSQRLRSQLEFGADADVFASADEVQMALAVEGGLVDGDSADFAATGMSIIAAGGSTIHGVADIARPGVKLVMAHDSVPAGRYGRELLERLSRPGEGLGHDFAAKALQNVVSEETSVKFVEQKVNLGEADAGIVYRPGAISAKATGDVRVLPLPASADGVRARYPIAILSGSDSPDAAASFVTFVHSAAAQDILVRFGFDSP